MTKHNDQNLLYWVLSAIVTSNEVCSNKPAVNGK